MVGADQRGVGGRGITLVVEHEPEPNGYQGVEHAQHVDREGTLFFEAGLDSILEHSLVEGVGKPQRVQSLVLLGHGFQYRTVARRRNR